MVNSSAQKGRDWRDAVEEHRETLEKLASAGGPLSDDARRLLAEYEGVDVEEFKPPKEKTTRPVCDNHPGVINPRWRGGFVYAIQSASGAVKIGKSTSPKRRLKTLQTGHREELKLAAAAGVDDAAELEKTLHREFSDHNARGEWFEITDEMLELLIRRLETEADDADDS